MLWDENMVNDWAWRLYQAERAREPIDPLTETLDVSVDQAYAIQEAIVALKLGAGQRIVGKKIGLTSAAMQAMMQVHQPDFGHLMDTMEYVDGAILPLSMFIQPRLEAEIAFVLATDLVGPGVTAWEVLEATAYVQPALEIVDSRINAWRIKLGDTIADNASSGAYVLGGPRSPARAQDLGRLGMVLTTDGEVLQTSAGAAALGHPARSVAWLANQFSTRGVPLKAGEVVLSGALGAAVDIRPNVAYQARFGGLGAVSCQFITTNTQGVAP